MGITSLFEEANHPGGTPLVLCASTNNSEVGLISVNAAENHILDLPLTGSGSASLPSSSLLSSSFVPSSLPVSPPQLNCVVPFSGGQKELPSQADKGNLPLLVHVHTSSSLSNGCPLSQLKENVIAIDCPSHERGLQDPNSFLRDMGG